jgi:hypothetical protein
MAEMTRLTQIGHIARSDTFVGMSTIAGFDFD